MTTIKKSIIFSIMLLVMVCSVTAQEKVSIRKKEFITSKEGSKEAWKATSKGNSTYNKGRVYYKLALENYLKAYAYNSKNAALNYKIGTAYLYSDGKANAITYLKEAYNLKNTVTKDIQFQMARAYHMNYEFNEAIKCYKAYKASMSERKLKKLKIDIDKYIAECENGVSYLNKPERAVIENVGKNINTESDDYYPVFDSKEETMYFTSRRPSKLNNKRNELDQKFSEDIFVSKYKSGDWGISQLLSKKLFSKKSDAALAISPDNSKLYIYRSARGGDIYYSTFKNGSWSSPKSFKNVNSTSRETSLSFTADGKTCYFVSDRSFKNALGGKDIYVIKQNAKGKWQKPENLGSVINSSANEEAVYVSKDGKALYFSSNRSTSMGGYDIYKSELTESGNWSTPKNLGYPINTPDDDLYFRTSGNKKIAYLSANRENSLGGFDIYKLVFLGAEKQIAPISDISLMAYELFDKKTLNLTRSELLTIDSSIIVTGKIMDSETKKGLVAKIQYVDPEKSAIAATFITDSTGIYRLKLAQKKNYGLEITSKGYLFFLDAMNLTKEQNDIVQKDYELKELSVGAKVVLKSIFFETGKAALKMESFQQLDNVISFMKENQTLTLEISGHTDNVGAPAANTKLSQARAKAVVDYMITQGIASNRLTYKGYGPKQPIAKNTTKEGKAMNRRVEFKITGK